MHVSLDSALGRQRRLNSVGESALQIAPSAAAAYSLRSLTGGDPKVVRVRRSSDDAEQDFTASGVSSGALVDFVGSGNDGFVDTWYDQSGNNKNALQATSTKQPKIVNSGTLLNELDFDGTDDTLAIDFGADLSQASSLFIVHQSDTNTGISNEFFDSAGGVNPRTLLDQSGTKYRMFSTGASVSTGVTITTDKSLIFALFNGTSSLFAKNGTATGALNAGTTEINQNSALGSSATRFYDGTMQEVIIYNSDQSSNRVALETNINSHYSIF